MRFDIGVLVRVRDEQGSTLGRYDYDEIREKFLREVACSS
jgi:hypothetical protein